MVTLIIICIVVYLLSAITCKVLVDIVAKHDKIFMDFLAERGIGEGFLKLPYIPVMNTIFILVFVLSFARHGFNFKKMKMKK